MYLNFCTTKIVKGPYHTAYNLFFILHTHTQNDVLCIFGVLSSKCSLPTASQFLCSAITFRGATMILRFWEHERSKGKRGNKILGFIFAT